MEKKEKKKKNGEKKAKVSDVFSGNELLYEEKVINSVLFMAIMKLTHLLKSNDCQNYCTGIKTKSFLKICLIGMYRTVFRTMNS